MSIKIRKTIDVQTFTPAEPVAVKDVPAVAADTVEEAKNLLTEFIAIMRGENPEHTFTVVGDSLVEGGITAFDNRTYTMTNAETQGRQMKIEGNYGRTADFKVTMMVEVGAAQEAAPNQTNTTAPQTGDNSNPLVWAAVLLLSCGGILGVMVCSKKKKYSK